MATQDDVARKTVQSGLTLVVLVCNIIAEPFVIVALWRWYAVPLGVPAIHWAQAFGLNLLVSVFVARWPGDRTPEQNFKAVCHCMAVYLTALALGWLVLKLAA